MLKRLIASAVAPGRVAALRFMQREGAGWTAARSAQMADEVWREACRRVPYYREIADGMGGVPEFVSAPVLTRSILRARLKDIRAEGPAGGYLKPRWTGGSTGEPVSVFCDAPMRDWSLAAQDFCHQHFLGIKPFGHRTVMLWGSDIEASRHPRDMRSRLMRWATGSVWLNTFRMSPEKLAQWVDNINRVRPHLIYSYAGSAYNVARFAHERGLRLHRPLAVSTTAEMLQPGWREVIREAFGVEPSSYYATRETGPVAMECRAGQLHILAFHVHVEVVGADGGTVPPGTEGRILLTTLRNSAMPLVRYEIGDLGALAPPDEACPCGCALPVLRSLAGRVGDYLLALDGTRVKGGYFHTPFFRRVWLREYQIVQTAADRLRVNVVQSAPRPAGDTVEIERFLCDALGAGMNIDWNEVPEIPPTHHGKRLITRLELKEER